MKALLVSPSAVPGGAERALASLARRLPEHGIDCEAVLLQPGPLESWLSEVGCPTEVIEAKRARHPHRTAATIAALAWKAKGADVVLSNQSKGHVYGGLAARLAGRPAVWWQQGVPVRSRLETIAASVPSAAVIVSSRLALDAQRRIAPRALVVLVHLGIDVSGVRAARGSGASIRAERGWGDEPLVGIVGRLQPWKGQDDFLRAAALVARSHAGVRFVIVGGAILGWEGTYPAELETLAQHLGMHDRVSFVGHQDDVYPWFDALDIAVHASHGEPFGLVLVEAMALGKPLVATAAGGPTEIVEDGESGMLVPPRDHVAMAASISELLADDHLRHRIGAAAEVRSETFDERCMATHIAGLLEEVVAGGGLTTATGDLSGSDERAELREGTDQTREYGAECESSHAMAGELTHETVAALLDPPLGGAVLDAGAGAGAFTRLLAEDGFCVTAAGIRPDQYCERAPYVVCNFDEQLPFGNDTFEGIVAIELIEHLEAPFPFIRDVARCLRDGGWFIATTPNVLSLASKLSFAVRDVPIYFDSHEYETNGHISPVSLVDMQRIASRSGLQVEQVCYSVGKIPVPKLRHWVPLRHPRWRSRALGESLIVKMRKIGPPVSDIARG